MDVPVVSNVSTRPGLRGVRRIPGLSSRSAGSLSVSPIEMESESELMESRKLKELIYFIWIWSFIMKRPT